MCIFFIPWKVKKFVADYFPEFYHILRNINKGPNSLDAWNKKLEESWDSELWTWPDKNELIVSLIENKSKIIIDIGCGNGSILKHLKNNGYTNLHGLELSTYAFNRLTQEGITMHRSELPSIELSDDNFDYIIASEVLEHIIRRHTFIKELKRIMRNDGKLLIFVPDNCQGPMDEKEHVRKYNSSSLYNFLNKYFSTVQVNSFKDGNHTTQFLYALCSN